MRDERYKAVHRGGPLSLEKHRLLASWAASCVEHVLYLFTNLYPADDRPLKAIETARAWVRGGVTVGAARAKALEAHAAARDANDDTARFIARSSGHAVATAHMADHAPKAAMYAIRATRAAYKGQGEDAAVQRERAWQQEHLSDEIRELVFSTLEPKYAS